MATVEIGRLLCVVGANRIVWWLLVAAKVRRAGRSERGRDSHLSFFGRDKGLLHCRIHKELLLLVFGIVHREGLILGACTSGYEGV